MFRKPMRVMLAVLVVIALLAGAAVAQACAVKSDKQSSKQQINVNGKGNKVVVVKNNVSNKAKPRKPKVDPNKNFGTINGVTILLRESSPTSGSVVNTLSIECSKSIELTPSVEASGTPLAYVHLRLLKKKGKRGFEKVSLATQSNKCGVFTFKKVKPGDYVLRVWSKKAVYVGTTPINVHVDAGGKVTLRLGFKAKPAPTARKCSLR